jgi:NCS1 family nucleobase:cation symporter-1
VAVKTRASTLEQHSIEPIPETDRHGRPRDQFTLWFAANATALYIFFGGLAVSLGLTLWWAIAAIVLGTLIGTAMSAVHAQQGPRLGVPQLIQSRGQFGYYGALFFFLCLVVLDFGFMASQMVIQAFSLNQVLPGVGIPWWIIIVSVPVLVMVIYGYDLMHRVQRFATIVMLLTAVVMAVQVFTFHSAYKAVAGQPFSMPIFLAVTAVFVVGSGAWAPHVSDYSRYLPSATRFWGGFWAVTAGIATASISFAILGAKITAMLPSQTLYSAVQHVNGSWALVIMGISLTGCNAINSYTGGLSALSGLSTVVKVSYRARNRILSSVIVLAAGIFSALAGYQSFLNTFVGFLDVLAFVFFPWSAINIIDFYVIHRGRYDVASFYSPHGRYGKWLPIPIACYLIGLGVESLFVNQSFYQGPLVSALGGNDISWIVGFVVPFIVYYLLAGTAKRLSSGPAGRAFAPAAEDAQAGTVPGSGATP